MARTYAGILGPLACAVSLARGLLVGGGADGILWTAWCQLWVFAAVGATVGWIAQRTVEESVRGRIAAELAGQAAPPAAAPEK